MAMEPVTADRPAHLARRLLLWAAFVLALVVLLPFLLTEPDRFDEGFIASGSMLARRGWLPIDDFYVIYGPGQYWLLAGAFATLGEDLLVLRTVSALCQAALCAALTECALRLSSDRLLAGAAVASSFVLLTAASTPDAGYPAVTATLLLALAALTCIGRFGPDRRPAITRASLILGVCAWFRWDFGLFGVTALCMAVTLTAFANRTPARSLALSLAAAVVPALLVSLAAFGPLIAPSGLQRWLTEVPIFLLQEFNTWRGLDYVGPNLEALRQAFGEGNRWGWSRALLKLVMAGLPMVIAPIAAIVAAHRLVVQRHGSLAQDQLALLIALSTVFLLNQMRVRPGLPQGYPALVMCLPLLAYLWQSLAARRAGARLPLAAAAACALLLAAYVFQGDVKRLLHSHQPFHALPRASHLRVSTDPRALQELVDYSRLVQHVRATTRPDERILSGVADTSRLFVNDAMLYFLADRLPATRWVEMEPGITNTVQGQQELIADLQRHGVNTIVLWRQFSTEPNASSRGNGTRLLDDFVHAHFVESARFGQSVVLVRRSPSTAPLAR